MFVGMPPELNEIEILPETGSAITETTADTRIQAAVGSEVKSISRV